MNYSRNSVKNKPAYSWSDPTQILDQSGDLKPGQSVDVSKFKWIGESKPGTVRRWGFRSTAQLLTDNFVVKQVSKSGKVLRSGSPTVNSLLDSDGLYATAVETTVVDGCASLQLHGLRGSEGVLLIGPVAYEEYARSERGAMLGQTTKLIVPEGHSSVRLEGLTINGTESSQAHFAVRFFDLDANEILPSADTSLSPVVGSYVVLRKTESTGWSDTQFPLPTGTSSIDITPMKSRPEAALTARLVLRTRPKEADSIEAFLSDLGAETPLIFIDSTAPPFGSGLITIRPNNMTAQYSSLGYAVVSVGYGELQGSDRRPSPLVYQAPRSEFGMVLERLERQAESRPCLYVCSSFPSPTAVTAVDKLGASGWRTLYEIRDDMEEFKRVGYSKWHTAEGESLICRRVDFITTVSPALADKAKALAMSSTVEPFVIPNGIQPHFIEKGRSLRSLDVVERKRAKGIVGYVGHLTDAWFDWEYVLRCAESLPDNQFEIIGPGKPPTLRLPRNVSYLGPKPQHKLQEFTSEWAVGLVPFKKSPLTRAVDPNKLFEYVAWGMRTVAAEMGSIDDCPTAVAYHTYDEMLVGIRDALSRPWTQYELDAAERFLSESTWRNRALETLEVVGL